MKKILLIALLLLSTTASAHSTGASLEKNEGEYLLDVGVTTDQIKALEQVRFDFNLYKTQSTEEVPFDSVWVRIMQGDKLMFSSTLAKPVFGLTVLSYIFPYEGDYDMTVRYNGPEEKQIVETSYLLNINDAETESSAIQNDMVRDGIIGVVGFILGIAAIKLFKPKPVV